MICPTCGAETQGRDHNGRGLRCTSCWALLPDPDDLTELGLDPQQVSQAGELGIRTFRDVYEADLATLQEIEGVGPVTAGKLHEGAEARL